MNIAINPIGLVAAMTAFLGIWVGHVSVRVVERNAKKLWLPILIAVVLGLFLAGISLFIDQRLVYTISGILGITILWDAFELVRQEKRIKKGHAPANPNNPRHVAILDAIDSRATQLDLLGRDPVGRRVDESEAIALVAKG